MVYSAISYERQHCLPNRHLSTQCRAISAKPIDIPRSASKNILGKGLVNEHMEKCAETIIQKADVEISSTTPRGEIHLLALWIRELKPTLNSQGTMKSRQINYQVLAFLHKLCFYFKYLTILLTNN